MDGCKIGASACMLPMISVPTTASAERIRTFSSRVVLRFSLGVPMSGSGAEMIPIPVDDDDDAADDDDDDDDDDTPLLGCGPLSALTAVLSSSSYRLRDDEFKSKKPVVGSIDSRRVVRNDEATIVQRRRQGCRANLTSRRSGRRGTKNARELQVRVVVRRSRARVRRRVIRLGVGVRRVRVATNLSSLFGQASSGLRADRTHTRT